MFPRVLAEITAAAGTDGMIGGQVVDVQSEGQAVPAETLEYIHTRKTAALIRGALRSGALLAGASEPALAALTAYGDRIGLAFQIVDDILDVEGSLETLGKTAGSDAAQAEDHLPGGPRSPRLQGARGARSSARPTPRSRPSGPGRRRSAPWPTSS